MGFGDGMANSATKTENVIAAAMDISAPNGVVSRRVKLLPFGNYFGRDGRGPFVLDSKAQAEAVIAATRKFLGTSDMLFNYDHQSEFAAVEGVGGQAKASGWIKAATLTAGTDGIYGDVDWTTAAMSAIAAKEYRYYSPHFRVSKVDRRVTLLVNVALTNSPNLDVPALASQSFTGLADDVQLTDEERDICARVGVPEAQFLATKRRDAQAKETAELNSTTPKRGEITDAEAAICAAVGIAQADYVKTRDGAAA